MRKFLALVLLTIPGLLAAVPVAVSQRSVPNSVDALRSSVEVIQVAELPVIVNDVVLTKTRNGYVLKCSLSNNSPDPIVELDYLLLVIDANNSERHVIDGTQNVRLKGYATKAVISKAPVRFEIGDGDRLFLIPHRVFSRDYLWEVLKVKQVLAAYASGDYSVTPEVVRALNLVDSPLRSRTIY